MLLGYSMLNFCRHDVRRARKRSELPSLLRFNGVRRIEYVSLPHRIWSALNS